MVLDIAENPLGGGITENIGNMATVCKCCHSLNTADQLVSFLKQTSLTYIHATIS